MFVLVSFSFFFGMYGSGHTVGCISSEKIISTGTLQSMFNFRSLVLRNGTSLCFKLRCAAFLYIPFLIYIVCLISGSVFVFRMAKEIVISLSILIRQNGTET